MKQFLAVVLLLGMVALVGAQIYDFRAPVTARAGITTTTLVVTGTFYLISGDETLACWSADSVITAALAGDLRGTWKTKDTTAFGMITRANAWTAANIFSDLRLVNGATITDTRTTYTTITQDTVGVAGVLKATSIDAATPWGTIYRYVSGDSLYFYAGADTWGIAKTN